MRQIPSFTMYTNEKWTSNPYIEIHVNDKGNIVKLYVVATKNGKVTYDRFIGSEDKALDLLEPKEWVDELKEKNIKI